MATFFRMEQPKQIDLFRDEVKNTTIKIQKKKTEEAKPKQQEHRARHRWLPNSWTKGSLIIKT